MNIMFGIDFGTTNSALSIYRNGNTEIIDIDSGDSGNELLRSVLYFNDDHEVFVGNEAILQYLWDGASGRFMQSIKTFLPNTSFISTEIFGKQYSIDDLVAIILKNIKTKGEAYVGCEVDSVVLGRPVYFSSDPVKNSAALKRLETAARKAGFKHIVLQYEPVAAAFAYEASLRANEEKIVFIGDFGGGTSDFSIIRVNGGSVSRGDRLKDVLSLGGVYIAGDKFDSQIMWDVVAKYFGRDSKYKTFGTDEWVNIPKSLVYSLSQWHKIPLLRTRKNLDLIRLIKNTSNNRSAVEHLENIINENFGFFLFQSIEKAKCELTGHSEALIQFMEKDLTINEPLTRTDFERMNKTNFDRLTNCIDDVLKESGLCADQIDTVFLTGGTSKIPYIKNIFVERFGAGKLDSRSDLTSVVRGLPASILAA